MSPWETILQELPAAAVAELETLMNAAPDLLTVQAEIIRILTCSAPSNVALDRWLEMLGGLT